MLIIGVDIETTGTHDTPGSRIVQIGAACTLDPASWFSSLVGHRPGEAGVDPAAMAVHGIDYSDIMTAPAAHEVDAALCEWLAGNGATAADPAVACGWNVASFDLRFIADELPHTRTLLARRSIDLNALCLERHNAYDSTGTRRSWRWWKEEAKLDAARHLEALGVGNRPHDATWDAAAALCILEFLRNTPCTFPQHM